MNRLIRVKITEVIFQGREMLLIRQHQDRMNDWVKFRFWEPPSIFFLRKQRVSRVRVDVEIAEICINLLSFHSASLILCLPMSNPQKVSDPMNPLPEPLFANWLASSFLRMPSCPGTHTRVSLHLSFSLLSAMRHKSPLGRYLHVHTSIACTSA